MKVIKDQFNQMLDNGIYPCFEYPMVNDEYLIVNLQVCDKGIEFSFDSDNKRVAFDGDIIAINDNRYLLPYDECFDNLDHYSQMIDQNIIEGFLLPNDLYQWSE